MRDERVYSPVRNPSEYVHGTGGHPSTFQENVISYNNKKEEQSIECPHCGQTLIPGEGYCWECGEMIHKK